MSHSSLLSLPLELLQNIFHRLDLQDKERLAMTNRTLRTIIEPPTHDDFLRAETDEFAKSKQLFTCRSCMSFRKHTQFSDDMRKGRRARCGPDAHVRLCIRCGVKQSTYHEGMEIAYLGQRAILGRFCRTLTDHHARSSTLCGSVWISVRMRDTQRYHDYLPYANEDDWVRSKLSITYFDEMERHLLDI